MADFSMRADPLTLSNDGLADSGGAGERTTISADVAAVFGGTGGDRVTLTGAGQFASGGGGNDTLNGGGANDVLVGGSGSNAAAASGAGHDALFLRNGSADVYFADATDLLQLDGGLDTPGA